MSDTEKLDYERMWQEENPFAHRLAYWIKHVLNPNRVIDMGCGPGMHVYALRGLEVEAIGYDIDERVLDKPYLHHKSIFNVWSDEQADLVLCLEVAEHLPENVSDQVVEACVDALDHHGILIWTAAIPGQGGVGHINCQPKEYWEAKFKQNNMTRLHQLEGEMLDYIRRGYHMGWFTQNAMIFLKL